MDASGNVNVKDSRGIPSYYAVSKSHEEHTKSGKNIIPRIAVLVTINVSCLLGMNQEHFLL